MHLEDGFHIFTNGVFNPIGPRDGRERAHLESQISADYERCHPGETLDDLKHRARFSKEDKGLLYDWMVVAAQRAIARRNEKAIIGLHIAA